MVATHKNTTHAIKCNHIIPSFLITFTSNPTIPSSRKYLASVLEGILIVVMIRYPYKDTPNSTYSGYDKEYWLTPKWTEVTPTPPSKASFGVLPPKYTCYIKHYNNDTNKP